MLIYAGLLLLDLGFLYLIAASGASGAAYITLTIVSLVGLLLAYHVWQHIRDLGSPLAETEGAILRKWSRAEFIIAWQNYYIYVEHAVFKRSLHVHRHFSKHEWLHHIMESASLHCFDRGFDTAESGNKNDWNFRTNLF